MLENLKQELQSLDIQPRDIGSYLKYLGFSAHLDEPVPLARAYAAESLFCGHRKQIYRHDRIVGSIYGLVCDRQVSQQELAYAKTLVDSYGANSFGTNADHYAPNYEAFLSAGVNGVLQKIQLSMQTHQGDLDAPKRLEFLSAAEVTMKAFQRMLIQYGEAAAEKAETEEDKNFRLELMEASRICHKLSAEKPESFREALQLIWLAYIAFVYEGRYAMAFGRMDQYLYPFFEKDLDAGRIDHNAAVELLSCAFYKISEHRWLGGDDVVNIAIGGLRADGSGGVNELSYCILEAVHRCNIPGPNLSARCYEGMPDSFLDACLQVIGTGLGYPALMNDGVNIPALHRHGYSLEDSRNYCMVGCIENFIQGKQPPWTDGRFNTPKYLELALNDGRCMLTGVQMGPKTGAAEKMATMQDVMEAFRRQMVYGAADYMARFHNENERYNRARYVQPFLSCFCDDCIERGLDINDGGAHYPSVHGACCMGTATVADSLAAIERIVYEEKVLTLAALRDVLLVDYEGHEDIRRRLLSAPKYGNNDDFVDKYAVWFVKVQEEIFSKYHTWDGGPIYIAIASNVSNIPAGEEVAATPDGRKSRSPLSDASSPMHGRDTNGPTAVLHSMAKPDYTLASCGTVLNQKYSPVMFTDPAKRQKLLSLVKVYFQKGGQEVQMNAVSREMLMDAQKRPEQYKNLVVRVSGFSAFYTSLSKEVQNDILMRTEHD